MTAGVTQLAIFGDSLANSGYPIGASIGDGGNGGWNEIMAEMLANLEALGPMLSSGMRMVSSGIQSGREWTYTGSWTTVASTDAWDRLPYSFGKFANGAANIAKFTKPTYWRKHVGFKFMLVDYTNGGNFQYRLDGGSWVNINQGASLLHNNTLLEFYVGQSFSSTFEVRASSDDTTGVGCFPAGIELFWSDPTVVGVRGFIAHHLAIGSQNLHKTCATSSGDRLSILDSVRQGTGSPIPTRPTATLMLHINDVKDFNNTTTWATDLTTFFGRAGPLGPVGFISPYECKVVTYALQSQIDYRQKTKETSRTLGAKTLDLFDLMTARGYVEIPQIPFGGGAGALQTGSSMTGVQSGTLDGTSSYVTDNTGGDTPNTAFPRSGEFSVNGLNGYDQKITYESKPSATQFGRAKLVTGPDIQLTVGDLVDLTQEARMFTDGLTLDEIHSMIPLHSILAILIYWWARKEIFGISTAPSRYPVVAKPATVAYAGKLPTVAYAAAAPVTIARL